MPCIRSFKGREHSVGNLTATAAPKKLRTKKAISHTLKVAAVSRSSSAVNLAFRVNLNQKCHGLGSPTLFQVPNLFKKTSARQVSLARMEIHRDYRKKSLRRAPSLIEDLGFCRGGPARSEPSLASQPPGSGPKFSAPWAAEDHWHRVSGTIGSHSIRS